MPTIVKTTVGGGSASRGFGFPAGWSLKSIALGDTFPGFSSNVIPLTISTSLSVGGSSHSNGDVRSTGGWSQTKYYNPNNKNGLKLEGSGGGHWRDGSHTKISSLSTEGAVSASGYGIWLPPHYNYDYNALYNGVKSGTVTTWLEHSVGDKHYPDGTGWKLKSTKNGDTYPGASANVIPVTVQQAISIGLYDTHGSGQDYLKESTSNSASINSKTVLSISGWEETDADLVWEENNGGAGISLSSTVTIYEAFLPYFYNFNYSAIQSASISGTVVEWFQK